ncbi:MAG: copper resistance protein CopC [Pseudohongiella sp.]|nr:copper resistance protein CopC [Pseudohongiella sp.]
MRLMSWFKSLMLAMGVFAALGMLSGPALAHSVLSASSPGDKSVVSAPEKLELTFNEAVRVLRLTLVHGASHEIDIGFTPSTEAAQMLSYELPMLMMGAHTVNWTVIGSDGHPVNGTFGFTVSADGAPAHQMMHSHGNSAPAHDGGHQH